VVIVDDESSINAIAAEEASTQSTATILPALVSADPRLHLAPIPSGTIASRDRELKSRFPDRLERPPRLRFC
jgi:hypothetical protein